jgi:hypothetical protein
MDTAKRVSDAIKNKHPGNYQKYHRRETARKVAQKMWAHVVRIREWGTRLPSGEQPKIPRAIINVMCFGGADEHNRRMIKKYTEAAKAAERFLRGR